MEKIDYFKIIHKYLPPESSIYRIYIPHVSLVTAKALRVAKKLGLSHEQVIFIEEAAMLHDIGIVEVKRYSPSSDGDLPYICHAPVGREILECEGLPKHALVAERHIGVGISKREIIGQQFPLPHRDMLPQSIEEKIICWADLFFGKKPEKLWIESSLAEVKKKVARYGERQEGVFQKWTALFGGE